MQAAIQYVVNKLPARHQPPACKPENSRWMPHIPFTQPILQAQVRQAISINPVKKPAIQKQRMDAPKPKPPASRAYCNARCPRLPLRYAACKQPPSGGSVDRRGGACAAALAHHAVCLGSFFCFYPPPFGHPSTRSHLAQRHPIGWPQPGSRVAPLTIRLRARLAGRSQQVIAGRATPTKPLEPQGVNAPCLQRRGRCT